MSSAMPESYGDELMDGVDLEGEAGGTNSGYLPWHRRMSPEMYAWFMVVIALGLLWTFGGVVFKSANR